MEKTKEAAACQPASAPPARSRRAARMLLLAALSLGSMAFGYLVRSQRPPDAGRREAYEIRGGSTGLTNPLLECEVGASARGREPLSFRPEIEAIVDRLIAGHQAERIALYFRDLDNGPWFGIREQEPFTGASLLKVPTIVALLLQVEESPALLARKIRFEGYPDEDSPGQYVPEQRLVRGQVYTVDNLMLRAAAYSDNAAIGILNGLVRPEYLARVYRELDIVQPSQGPIGMRAISPLSYGHLFRVLYNASYLTRSLSEHGLRYFTQSAFHAGLEAGVPPGTTIAHKFGIYSLPGVTRSAQLHDCGIVYYPGRPYFLCVMTEGRDAERLAAAIGELSRTVFLSVAAQPDSPAGGKEWPPSR